MMSGSVSRKLVQGGMILTRPVTGCSSGLGAALARHVYQAGCPIVATARDPKTLSYLPDSPTVLKLPLDVTSEQDVKNVMKLAVEKFGRVSVVVNNAGYGLSGDTEAIPDADARAQLETNFWGAANVTKAALPVFRETNKAFDRAGGLVIQISSMGGRLGFPGSAFYHARYAFSLSEACTPSRTNLD